MMKGVRRLDPLHFGSCQNEARMRYFSSPALAFILLATSSKPVVAHYQMLLPQPASAKRNQQVVILYQWGHPFEHQLVDAAAPRKVLVLAPGGGKSDLTAMLKKIAVPGADKKSVTAFRLHFTPKERGDYVFVLTTDPIWMDEEKVFYQDTVRVVLHVQDQDGWDTSAGQPFELLPLTRPYGLEPGMVFQAQVLAQGKPVLGTLVEIEPYNAEPPNELPPDEQITRTAKTDPNGVVTGTLTGPGWWCLTAQRSGGLETHLGKRYPVRQRTTLWVYVAERKNAGRR
jgi:cobalt/nickel transport protein